MVYLKNITVENFDEVVELKVKGCQEEFCLSNMASLAECYVMNELRPLAIYDDEKAVGFLMYCLDRDDHEFWIYRFMIDEKYQCKGYAMKALQLLLKKIKSEDETKHKIFLDVHLESESAVSIYKKAGFDFDGRVFGSSHVMVLNY